jgi:hypothetical protein
MPSLGGKVTAPECHPTKKVNKAEELTYLSTNIDLYWLGRSNVCGEIG